MTKISFLGTLTSVKARIRLFVVPQYLVQDKIDSGAYVKISIKEKDFENKLALVQLPDKKAGLAEKMLIAKFQTAIRR